MEYFEIKIEDCRFYAYHGLLPHEREIGNNYNLSVIVRYPVYSADGDNIEDSISYADLFTIAKEEMENPRKLLETVTASIGKRIEKQWPKHLGIEVTLTKVTPPIPGFLGKASVSYISSK